MNNILSSSPISARSDGFQECVALGWEKQRLRTELGDWQPTCESWLFLLLCELQQVSGSIPEEAS